MKIKNSKKLIPLIIFALFIGIFSFVTSATAATPDPGSAVLDTGPIPTYVPISGSSTSQFLGFSGNVIQVNNLNDFIGKIFDFGVALAIGLALIMIMWGGIEYMTTDSWMGKEDGKKKIKDALYGLGLAIFSYVILYTINPCLVQFIAVSGGCQNANTLLITPPAPPPAVVSAASSTCSVDLSPQQQLQNDGITVVSSGNCGCQENPSCTSFYELPSNAVSGLIQANDYCKTKYGGGCIAISGGTEVGHKSHGPNIATVDVQYNPKAIEALKSVGLTENSSFGGEATRGIYTCEPNGGGSVPVVCGPGAGTIHVQF